LQHPISGLSMQTHLKKLPLVKEIQLLKLDW
jgi:hypothetical protein